MDHTQIKLSHEAVQNVFEEAAATRKEGEVCSDGRRGSTTWEADEACRKS